MSGGSRLLLRLRAAEEVGSECAETGAKGLEALEEFLGARRLGHHDDAVGAGPFQLCLVAGVQTVGLASEFVFHLLDDAVGVVLGIACEGVLRAGREGIANGKL